MTSCGRSASTIHCHMAHFNWSSITSYTQKSRNCDPDSRQMSIHLIVYTRHNPPSLDKSYMLGCYSGEIIPGPFWVTSGSKSRLAGCTTSVSFCLGVTMHIEWQYVQTMVHNLASFLHVYLNCQLYEFRVLYSCIHIWL